MKATKKVVFVIFTTLMVFSALCLFAGSALAASNPQVSISTNNQGVGEAATNTFVLTNTGTNSLAGVNVTIAPGYTNPKNFAITQQPASQSWSITQNGAVLILNQTGSGLSNGQSITFSIDATNPPVAGSYSWAVTAASTNGTTTTVLTTNVGASVTITSILPALGIFGIAAGFGFLTSGISRVLINHFVGWEQYRVMQKEMAEFRSEQMAAARANDKKKLEKLSKKQSQINNMQTKMFKPQMAQLATTFPITIVIWYFVLTPILGNISLAYLPGIGPIPVFWLYPLCSFFVATIAQRIIGLMPIEQ